jgi:hypothetical protein
MKNHSINGVRERFIVEDLKKGKKRLIINKKGLNECSDLFYTSI